MIDIETLTEKGSRIKGDIGGIPRQRYWTPDGREIRAIPSMREYLDRSVNPPVSGIRDANMDRGWLLQKPPILKPYCPHCDNWHDTQKEIDACGKAKKAFQNKYNRLAKKELKPNMDSTLEQRLSRMEKAIETMATVVSQMAEKGGVRWVASSTKR